MRLTQVRLTSEVLVNEIASLSREPQSSSLTDQLEIVGFIRDGSVPISAYDL
jgi:hypothetical protein